MNGKGSRSRVTDKAAYDRSYDRIFGKQPPNPGSPEAIALGCVCPVMDNHNGRGSLWGDGVFIYRDGCPVHRFLQWEALKKDVGLDKKPNVTQGAHKVRRD